MNGYKPDLTFLCSHIVLRTSVKYLEDEPRGIAHDTITAHTVVNKTITFLLRDHANEWI